jgi:hypothetical protein
LWPADRYGAAFRCCVLALLVPWCPDAVRVVCQGWLRVTTAAPTCPTEMHILHGIEAVARGRELYPVVADLPYNHHFYHPLTYLPTGLAARWLTLDTNALLVASRLLPFFSMLGIVALAGWHAWRLSRARSLAALSAAMVLYYHSSTLTDFFRNRPETPGLLLALAGWMVVQRRPTHWPYLAAALFAGAFALKQTFLAAPLACALQLLMAADSRNLVRLVGSGLALAAGVVAGSYLWLGQGYFDHAVAAMGSIPNRPIQGLLHFAPILFAEHWGVLPAAFATAAAGLLAYRRERALLGYFACSLLVTLLTHGKEGAGLNYHGELSLLMVLAVSAFMCHAWTTRSWWAWCPLVLLTAGTYAAIAVHGWGWNTVSHRRTHLTPSVFEYGRCSWALPYVERYKPHRGAALILDDEIAIRLGEPVVYDWFALALLFENGHVPFDPLERTVAQRRYSLLVFQPDLWDAWRRRLYRTALSSGYEPRYEDQFVLELVPRDFSHESSDP